MPTNFHKDHVAHEVVSAALPALYARCAEQGIAAAEVDSYLKTRFGTDHFVDTVFDYLHPPVKKADLVAQARAATREGNIEAARALSLEWLKQTHGVTIGDYLAVSGWVRPREVLLEHFQFCFESEREEPWLVFEGPTVHSSGIGDKCNLIEHSVSVVKLTGPSPQLARYLRARPVAQ